MPNEVASLISFAQIDLLQKWQEIILSYLIFRYRQGLVTSVMLMATCRRPGRYFKPCPGLKGCIRAGFPFTLAGLAD